MTWKKKDEHIDLRLGRHTIVLHEPESGAEHHLILHLGATSCAHCGHVRADEGEELDPKKHVAEHLEMLQASHDRMREYAKRHGVRVRKAGE